MQLVEAVRAGMGRLATVCQVQQAMCAVLWHV